MKKVLFVAFCVLLLMDSLSAQSVVSRKVSEGFFVKEYSETKNGTLEGEYKLFYKQQLIEKGNYLSGTKTGKWRYFSFNNILEYEFDYDANVISKIGGEIKQNGNFKKTPCFYHGSPLIPYLFMVNNIFYPKEAIEDDLSGRVVLTLKIDKKGKVYGYYLSERLHAILDKAVIDAAAKMPDDWQFIPASRNGYPLVSEYPIPIEFELTL